MMKFRDKRDEEIEEQPQKKLPYPFSVFFIVGNEFCERFSYYGMKSILSLYLKKKLKYSEDKATTIYHFFVCACYFTPILGAWIADQFLGKFKTIIYISVIYILGHILKTIAAVPNIGIDAATMTFFGLALIAIGTGGIKPCVSAFGGDQFKLPEQERQLQTFFTVFYFSINAGSFISTIVTPILREDVECFGDTTCYSLAFGVPAALMAVATVIIIAGKPLYKMNPPQGNIVFKVVSSIGHGISQNVRGERGDTHWMDVSKKEFGHELVEDVKVMLRVLVLFIPVPIWWALFDQTGSRWTFQATRMNGNIGAAGTIYPDQIQVMNPILILILLPLFDRLVYPIFAKCNFLKKPLQRMCLGGVLCAVSFVISGILELELQKTYAKIPGTGLSDIHLMNNIPCSVQISLMGGAEQLTEEIMSLDNHILRNIESNGSYSLKMSVDDTCLPDILTQRTETVDLSLKSGHVSAIILGVSGGNVKPMVIEKSDEPEKDNDANSKVRVIYDLGEFSSVNNFSLLSEDKSHEFNLTEPTVSSTNYTIVDFATYKIMMDESHLANYTLEQGGVYNLLVARDPETNKVAARLYTLTSPNSIHILWQFPQYFVITSSEVMFSVTGLEFSYSQAPTSMKSVLQAFWLLTVAFGNIIVILVAEAKAFNDQASEFFFFAALMLLDTVILIFLAWRYVPRKAREEQPDSFPMNNGLSNRNFKSDTEF